MSIGRDILRDYGLYTETMLSDVDAIAKEVQAKMAQDIDPVTPYGTGMGRKKTGSHFSGGKWVNDYTKTRVGHLKGNWKPYDIKVGDHTVQANLDESAIVVGRTIYGVRNKKKPMLVHLINFSHAVWAHGQNTGVYTHSRPPLEFVDKISGQGEAEMRRRLDMYFGG
jgi:hypothetical protein